MPRSGIRRKFFPLKQSGTKAGTTKSRLGGNRENNAAVDSDVDLPNMRRRLDPGGVPKHDWQMESRGYFPEWRQPFLAL